ncbi:MAG: HAMP domain-containing protein [Lachnospiraceae bacterium]|nr:HAMP domain-containing protein [Lachnospiraceae bacterium]
MDNVKKNKLKEIKAKIKNVSTMKESDLTSGMVRVILICWLIPYLTLSIVLFYSAEQKTKKQIDDTITTSLDSVIDMSQLNINSAVQSSKKASYDGTLKKTYEELHNRDRGYTLEEMNLYYNYIDSEYRYSQLFATTILLMESNESPEIPYSISVFSNGNYNSNIAAFKLLSKPKIEEVAKNLDTGNCFVAIDGKMYLVRNLLTNKYFTFATLVNEINLDYAFESFNNSVWHQDGTIFVDGIQVRSASDENRNIDFIDYYNNIYLKNKVTETSGTYYDSEYNMAYAVINYGKNQIVMLESLDKVGIMNERNSVIYAYVIILILLIPLLFATFYYFYAHISNPIADLMYASERIENGQYGYKLETFDKNREFGRLIDTFNHMSVSLEESFNKIYAEEIAVRDANMKALQSQINPHFLNNTLEIINWKARMAGNDDVSGMIESLGVMMEATMNRNNESVISLSEELNYVDAYLYIIKQRFGDKFKFEKEIDEKLLSAKIPRLIIQPIVENSVDHGGDRTGNRIGKLCVYRDDVGLHIVVENNGELDEENKKKIESLLNDESVTDTKHTNIGIRNVHLRLKLTYGEGSGLTITSPREGVVRSELLIVNYEL